MSEIQQLATPERHLKAARSWLQKLRSLRTEGNYRDSVPMLDNTRPSHRHVLCGVCRPAKRPLAQSVCWAGQWVSSTVHGKSRYGH